MTEANRAPKPNVAPQVLRSQAGAYELDPIFIDVFILFDSKKSSPERFSEGCALSSAEEKRLYRLTFPSKDDVVNTPA